MKGVKWISNVFQQREVKIRSFFLRVQLNEAQDEIMKKKELLEDLQPDITQTCKSVTHHKSDFAGIDRVNMLFVWQLHACIHVAKTLESPFNKMLQRDSL